MELSAQEVFAPPASLSPGANAGSLSPHIRYRRDVAEGELTAQTLAEPQFAAGFQPAGNDNYGPPGTRIVATLAVHNAGEIEGRWLLSTARASFRELRIGELHGDEIRWLADRNAPDVGENLQTYNGLALPFVLSPGETRRFVVDFEGAYSSILPLEIDDSETFFREQKASVAMVFGSVVGMLTLIAACVLIYGATGRWNFLWLALSEFFHAAFILQVSGYAVFYFLYDKGEWLYSTTYMLSCLYGAATAQFARKLLDAGSSYPRLDRWFRTGIAIALATVAAYIVGTLFDIATLRVAAKAVSIGLFAVFSIGLPIVAWIAVKREGWHYFPLLPAWAMTAAFVTYGFVASQSIVPGLLFSWRIYSPVGLFSALCLALTAALQMREVFRGKQAAERELVASLTDKLRLISETNDLKEARALAIATMQDQDRLIHASGHDSRQVVMALNSIVQFIEKRDDLDLPPDVAEMLQASAAQLEDVVATTLSGGMAVADLSGPVVLSRFALGDLLRQLTLIYRPRAQNAGLTFEVSEVADIEMICDRALLSRILSNLLSNAVKFSAKGAVRLSASGAGDGVVISISDEGEGMSDALLARLTDGTREQLRGNEEAEGTGFGFKASLALIQRVGGVFDVASRPGQGTTINLTLPLRVSGDNIPLDRFAGLAASRGIALVDVEWGDGVRSAPAGELEAIPIVSDRLAVAKGPWRAARLALKRPLAAAMLDHPLVIRAASRLRIGAA